jgi:hypothetical protein
MPPFTFQKAVFYIAKDGLLEGNLRHIARPSVAVLTASDGQHCRGRRKIWMKVAAV